ncbi:hypothetical protein AN214_04039 [Pseudoalteromonas sp. P1-9]|uniref:hypothetical protein n=1 Tax=Pseudoalteromonas sp. P1-9 TaxID=1710354 RepID=UPI0006D6317F|nr:hypothetical protein [Pseudoalteromonas sp. P1-9]KPV93940.1 hypothetical protein AN214_04039 [Pseudoalteromonas sp. P1-9]
MDIYEWYLNFFEMGSDQNITEYIMLIIVSLMLLASAFSIAMWFLGKTNISTMLTTIIVTASYFSTDSILAILFDYYEIESFSGIATLYLIFTTFDAATVLAILLITPWFRKEGEKAIKTMTSLIAVLLLINATNNFVMSLHIALNDEPNMIVYMMYSSIICLVDSSIVLVMFFPKKSESIVNWLLRRDSKQEITLVSG